MSSAAPVHEPASTSPEPTSDTTTPSGVQPGTGHQRLVARLRGFEEVARKRLEGTAAEKLAQRASTAVADVTDRVVAVRGKVARELPARLDHELDAWLARVGLVRKSRIDAQQAPEVAPAHETTRAA